MKKIAQWINEVIEEMEGEELLKDPSSLSSSGQGKEARSAFWRDFKEKVWKNKKLLQIAKDVRTLCKKFPVP